MRKKVRKTSPVKSVKKKNIHKSYKKLLFLTSVFLILISLVGIAFSLYRETPRRISSAPVATDSAFNLFLLGTASANLNPSFEAPTPTDTPVPTPTPNLHFRHSKWFFSFEQPEEATVYEIDPAAPKLVENSIGGTYVEISDKLYSEISIVAPLGQTLEQYFYNRMANIFDSEILEEKTATFSGTLKGYEARLKNFETKEDSILLFLPFRGNQFFEIVATFPKRRHVEEEKLFFDMIETLKAY